METTSKQPYLKAQKRPKLLFTWGLAELFYYIYILFFKIWVKYTCSVVTELSLTSLAHNEIHSSWSLKNTKEKTRAQCQRNSSAEKISILAKFFFFFNTVLDHMIFLEYFHFLQHVRQHSYVLCIKWMHYLV